MVRSRAARLLTLATAAILLGLHAFLALHAARKKSVTHDEILHVVSGYAYWRLHDYRLHPENGILPQRWATIPVALLKPNFPALEENPAWRTSGPLTVGRQFFYESGNDHFPLLMSARAMIVLFSVGTGALIFAWAHRLFGATGAVLSTGLYAFSPNFLAHGALATSDVCMTFFFLASVTAWWWHLHSGTRLSTVVSPTIFGLACVAKFSAVLLLPMLVLIGAWRVVDSQPLSLCRHTCTTRRAKTLGLLVSAVLHGLVAIGIIWACYGFRYAAANPELPPADQFVRPWSELDARLGFKGAIIRSFAEWRLLPEAFLYGFAYVLDSAEARSAFLNGNYSNVGWASFFPWTFALKTTAALLIGLALTFVILLQRWRSVRAQSAKDLYRIAPLLVLFAVYWTFSLTSNLNIGHRHILPTYPVLFIAVGLLARAKYTSHRRGVFLAVALIGLQVGEERRISPHYLAYFNPLSGGPATGWRHLVDSSLDWGQDLPELKSWLTQNGGRDQRAFLAYFGTGEPDYYNIRATRLPSLPEPLDERPWHALSAGIYAISATMLQHPYSHIRGEWTLAREEEYQKLRALEPQLLTFHRDAARRTEMLREASEAQWRTAWIRYETMRFARLCHYLRARGPDAHAGYSILIFRLTQAEVDAAVHGSLRAWADAVTSALERHTGD
jgi:hypothetical protein